MINKSNIIVAFALIFALGPVLANADPSYFAENGHFYEVVPVSGGLTWTAAKAAAEAKSHLGVGGHLVTITSAEENQFLVTNFPSAVGQPYWLGGFQPPGTPEPNTGWEWVTGEVWSYTNWAGGEPNQFGGAEEDALVFWTSGTWNDAPTNFLYGNGGYIVEYDVATEAVVDPGDDVLIFNQAGNPDSPNPLTAAYQEVLPGGGGSVEISCCRVLDNSREGMGTGRKYGDYLPDDFDIGLAVADTTTNPSCVDMPPIAMNTAILRPWQRGVLRSRGIPDDTTGQFDPQGYEYREHDIGVCFIEADVLSKGVVFSEEEAANVLGYSVNCAEVPVEHRPYTAGVTTSVGEREVDFPNVTRWTAECDASRSGKKYSDNVMVLNLRHDTKHDATGPYLSRLAAALKESIASVKLEGCVDNSEGFLDDLASLVQSAKKDMGKKGDPDRAVETLDNATRLALLIPTIPADSPTLPTIDPYGVGLSACPGNPKGLFVGRLMSLRGATCSELTRAGANQDAKAPANCGIPGDILFELPPLP